MSRKPKIPKGTRDFGPKDMAVREKAFAVITRVFKNHGAGEIDLPVFELRETLMGKYGEESKLIYDLEDQGGELLSLRYDLTVPFARYLAMNNIRNIKRYHIAKVYRRDNISVQKGRFREFYQCDFDIAGVYDLMLPDAEVVAVVSEILSKLGLSFVIKVNHRVLLDAYLDIAGVPEELMRTICSAIDKLDKSPWEAVQQEMVEKGLDLEITERIQPFVEIRGDPREMLAQLSEMDLAKHPRGEAAIAELTVLFDFLEALGVLHTVSLDLSLARGLNYYTGLIYEAVLTSSGESLGSIAAGGRYDTLVGMFSGKPTPCVGVSIGIERIFTILVEREAERALVSSTKVLVASAGGDFTIARMEVLRRLWDAEIPAEMLQKNKPRPDKQLAYALEHGIPLVVFIGENELKEGAYKVKNTVTQTQETVPVDELVDFIRNEIRMVEEETKEPVEAKEEE